MKHLEHAAVAFATALAIPSLLQTGGSAQTYASYSVEQADAGRLAYERSCASCHMANLQGAFEAPELAGPNFLNRWGGRSVNELFQYHPVVDAPLRNPARRRRIHEHHRVRDAAKRDRPPVSALSSRRRQHRWEHPRVWELAEHPLSPARRDRIRPVPPTLRHQPCRVYPA